MHLTRPKSSKGRSRPVVNSSLYTGDTDSIQGTPVSPDSPVYSRPDRNLRSQSQPIMCQARQLSQDEVLHMLQHAPSAPPQSLNKYKVLPSIGRRQSEVSPPGRSLDKNLSRLSLDKNLSRLSLSTDAIMLQKHEEPDPPTGKDARPQLPDPGPEVTKEAGRLLLAVRAPCGRRFQEHFNPTDTLLTVRASAELKFGVKYGEVSIEIVDVPRRTFTDMDLTLAQCGILNRSVLCVTENDSVEHE